MIKDDSIDIEKCMRELHLEVVKLNQTIRLQYEEIRQLKQELIDNKTAYIDNLMQFQTELEDILNNRS